MKKVVLGIVVFVLLAVSAFVYVEINRMNHSYASPEAALSNVNNPKLDVLEIIDTKFNENIAYVFFYSEVDIPENYLAAALIEKNKYGWRFDEIIGVGNIDQNNAGMHTSNDDYIVGFASKEVDKVTFGMHEAAIITLDKKDIKAWLFHDIDSDLMEQTFFDIKYLDKEGNELPY